MSEHSRDHEPFRPTVAMVNEGTYPIVAGGVSVWCDHLIRGLPDVDFRVYSIGAVSAQRLEWTLPKNVSAFIPIGMEPTPGRAYERANSHEHRAFLRAWGHFVDAMLRPAGETPEAFVESLRALHEVSRSVPIDQAIRSAAAFEALRDRWTRRHFGDRLDIMGRPTLGDVLDATTMLAMYMQPIHHAPEGDVIHSTAAGLGSLVAMAGKWERGIPCVLTEHGVYIRERYLEKVIPQRSERVAALGLLFFAHLNRAAQEVADVIAPVSNFNRRWEIRTGARSTTVRTIYNGVDPEIFQPVTSEPSTPTVSWIGRIDPLKDLETLIRAFALVRREIPDARLRLFGPVPEGNDWYLERCRATIDETRLHGVVTFEGPTSRPAEAHEAGHVVVLSSISEGFPFTVLEAMMSGRATVSTDVGGVAEAVGEAGLLVRARDAAGMAEAIVTLLTDDELRYRLGSEARQRALEQFTLDQMTDSYCEVYEELVLGVPTHMEQETLGRERTGERHGGGYIPMSGRSRRGRNEPT